jgi:L-ascorbate metabolism protein UlaG (beta-lactamase superfamily)
VVGRQGVLVLQRVTWLKNAAFRWDGDGLVVYIDPWGTRDDDPPADVILVTHAHFDHFVPEDIDRVRKASTKLVGPRDVAKELSGDVTQVSPGDSLEVAGVKVRTMPAYNVLEHRLDKHPKANGWVGYVLELSGSTYYHAGDTDHAPELDEVRADVTFLPVGGDPFLMGPEEAADLAKAISPQVAVPMHFGYVNGSPADGDRFQQAAAPVKVEVLTPTNPFERA